MPTVRLVNPPRKKAVTREEAERRQAQAVQFTRDVVGDPALADEIESLTAEEYAARKGFQLVNPTNGEEVNDTMSTQMTRTSQQPDVDAKLDRIIEQLRSISTARRANPTGEQSEDVGAKLDKIITLLEEPRRDRAKNPSDDSQGLPSPRAERRVKKLLAERDDIWESLQEAQDALDEDQPDDAQEILDEILDRFEFDD